ncbi:glycosyltransferase family 4 protein [Muricauda oceani]|uniref:Glycosyltransferase family 4 protein n=1 Tax=Flagellimonas oceani TaxID=2698672 RepID=A0A6G7J071_9FLAO|nr:glycosyltransferase family 4 protein [Allomuricauda oceani]MBW8245109.1 glycosyltransferase family 4 protein [Allomuricauda oceani]QII44196.1 glycosyltransferase family 4 protein [Allomuricauda oceani]
MKKNVLIIASLANSLPHFRGDFISELVRQGYTVYAAAPDISEKVSKHLSELGATYIPFDLDRTGLNPMKDFKSILQIKNLIKDNNIDLVFPYTIKPVVYGSIAASMTNTPTISLITGLGFTFSGASRKAKFLQKISKALYRYSLRKNKLVIFQNKDDRQLFLDNKIISKNQKTDIVNGSGVNLERYPHRTLKAKDQKVKFVIVARLIKEKGIQLFMDTASQLKANYPLSEFHIIGGMADSPSGIKMESLNHLHDSGTIIFHGLKDNVPEFLKDMHVFVLPTFYREGVPRSILEALSIGMPVITTDTPGCRETIAEGKNGFLIPPNNLDALVDACRYFLDNPNTIEPMGKESRKLAEKKFDVNIINSFLVDNINSVLTK